MVLWINTLCSKFVAKILDSFLSRRAWENSIRAWQLNIYGEFKKDFEMVSRRLGSSKIGMRQGYDLRKILRDSKVSLSQLKAKIDKIIRYLFSWYQYPTFTQHLVVFLFDSLIIVIQHFIRLLHKNEINTALK